MTTMFLPSPAHLFQRDYVRRVHAVKTASARYAEGPADEPARFFSNHVRARAVDPSGEHKIEFWLLPV
jgi:hypothetical protein